MNKKGFPGGSDGKKSACNAGDLGLVPEWGRSLEKGMDTHSIILAWRIPWAEEPCWLQSLWSQRVGMTKHSTWELNDLLNLLYSVQGKFLPIQIPQWLPILLYIKCYSIFQWYIKSYRCCSLAIFLKLCIFHFTHCAPGQLPSWQSTDSTVESYPKALHIIFFSSWKSFMYIHACTYSYNKLL